MRLNGISPPPFFLLRVCALHIDKTLQKSHLDAIVHCKATIVRCSHLDVIMMSKIFVSCRVQMYNHAYASYGPLEDFSPCLSAPRMTTFPIAPATTAGRRWCDSPPPSLRVRPAHSRASPCHASPLRNFPHRPPFELYSVCTGQNAQGGKQRRRKRAPLPGFRNATLRNALN